uniref:uncharacterized protein LOC118147384 isoform X1 n=1 Tax=Callithrix jacchus TaxID=9483 RepID=UPI0023DD5E7F|nr:uncharacterized protein LOC118147384 isoform X1 [Callithrix jacchus]
MFMQIFLWSLQIAHPPASSHLRILGENPGHSAWVNDRWHHDLPEQTSPLANSPQSPPGNLTEPGSAHNSPLPYSLRTQGSLKATGQGGIGSNCPVGTPRAEQGGGGGRLATSRCLRAAGRIAVTTKDWAAFTPVPVWVGQPVAEHLTSGAHMCCLPDYTFWLTFLKQEALNFRSKLAQSRSEVSTLCPFPQWMLPAHPALIRSPFCWALWNSHGLHNFKAPLLSCFQDKQLLQPAGFWPCSPRKTERNCSLPAGSLHTGVSFRSQSWTHFPSCCLGWRELGKGLGCGSEDPPDTCALVLGILAQPVLGSLEKTHTACYFSTCCIWDVDAIIIWEALGSWNVSPVRAGSLVCCAG